MWSELEIVELNLLENVDLCSCYVIQHFCDVFFVLFSYDYEGLCYTIELDPCLSVTHQRSYLYKIYLYKTYNKESPIVNVKLKVKSFPSL